MNRMLKQPVLLNVYLTQRFPPIMDQALKIQANLPSRYPRFVKTMIMSYVVWWIYDGKHSVIQEVFSKINQNRVCYSIWTVQSSLTASFQEVYRPAFAKA